MPGEERAVGLDDDLVGGAGLQDFAARGEVHGVELQLVDLCEASNYARRSA